MATVVKTPVSSEDGINVFEVEGRVVRSIPGGLGFAGYGHSVTVPFIPADELWIERSYSARPGHDRDCRMLQGLVELKAFHAGRPDPMAAAQVVAFGERAMRSHGTVPDPGVVIMHACVGGKRVDVRVVNGCCARDAHITFRYYACAFTVHEVWIDDMLWCGEWPYAVHCALSEYAHNEMGWWRGPGAALRPNAACTDAWFRLTHPVPTAAFRIMHILHDADAPLTGLPAISAHLRRVYEHNTRPDVANMLSAVAATRMWETPAGCV
ncbi:MAG: hypothetical protein WC732_09005 [Candidatus Omnitrophota bacterium]